ncbi:MAG: hypothetical protein ACPGES_04805 [Coraliomargarita sp.]
MQQKESVRALIATSFRRNWLPGLVLWCIAIALLIAYYNWPTAQTALGKVSDLKLHHGYLFSAISTGLCGGLIPYAIHAARGEYKTARRALSCLAFFLFFWAWKGVEVDALYRLQSLIWGSGNDPFTIFKKVCFDMLVFSALYAVPCIAVFNAWMDKDFNWRATVQVVKTPFYRKRIAVMIALNWMIWIPAVAVVYAMPAPLQVFMFNIVLCFWVLILSLLSQTD